MLNLIYFCNDWSYTEETVCKYLSNTVLVLYYTIKDTIDLIYLEIAHCGIWLTFENCFSHKQTGSKKERERKEIKILHGSENF